MNEFEYDPSSSLYVHSATLGGNGEIIWNRGGEVFGQKLLDKRVDICGRKRTLKKRTCMWIRPLDGNRRSSTAMKIEFFEHDMVEVGHRLW